MVLLLGCRYLCSSIEEFSAHTGLSQAFLGMIVLPIAGNACEHITGERVRAVLGEAVLTGSCSVCCSCTAVNLPL
jgi:Ca2+/H+ antiporter